jgi:HAD superfamily hydrolase (TIGR01509 family)
MLRMDAAGSARVAVMFDVDGTLVDSERDGHRVAFNSAFEELGLDDRWSVEEYGELLSTTGGQSRLRRYLSGRGMAAAEQDALVPRLHARKTELFVELVLGGAVPARPGAQHLLDELEAAGARLAVATTGTAAWVRPLLDRHFGLDRFETVVTGDEVAATKPDPEVYRLAMSRLGVGTSGAVAVEDSVMGLAAARAAGVRCAVVVNDYTRTHDLSGADLVVDGYAQPGVAATVLSDPHRLRPVDGLDTRVLLSLAGL